MCALSHYAGCVYIDNFETCSFYYAEDRVHRNATTLKEKRKIVHDKHCIIDFSSVPGCCISLQKHAHAIYSNFSRV